MVKSTGKKEIRFRTIFRESKNKYHHTVMPSDLMSHSPINSRNIEGNDEKTTLKRK